ncbi:amino acid transporter [Tilletiaria anomala UBC 951]|uniref:Amino acid transporter n=1 Tax=Tilletiaria anomala (strain ATCC 24038 / CBS 436.72 / UBC 951) TaxID=1037660 RepID=A0A066VAR9_TILAU|nr:amino acid transporter [Tilletiaria anomala UBC 951]KDN37368.1 amino acid transporter [Tilletiaria anomala UBC 951]
MSLVYWVVGAIIAGAGFAVYAEFATAIPRNGGELNYLQHAYRKPKYLVSIMYGAQALLLGQAAGNAYTAGRYFIRAGGGLSNEWGSRGIGVIVIASALIIHGAFLKWGLRFLNIVGMFKIVILLLIAFAGFAALCGHTIGPAPHNFADAFEGTRGDIFGVSASIYNAGWSYVGYSNAFYAMGEIRNPRRTVKIAGPLALGTIAVVYLLVQVAYFAAVPREEILGSEQIIAALFFKHMFGESSARALSVFVALSATANVFSVIFSQGRLNQALGRDGIVPFSKILASNRPFKSPLAGLSWHVVVTLIILLAPPAGDAYNFVLNLSSYPLNIVDAAVGIALVTAYLPVKLRPEWARDWSPPFRASSPVAVFFTLASLFLVITPWIPPKKAADAVYEHMWYGMAPTVTLGIFAGGAIYWLCWAKVLPRVGQYALVPTTVEMQDGTIATVFKKESLHS